VAVAAHDDFGFNYSVLGDTVNVASRLEARTKECRIPIVIGAQTEQQAKEKFATIEIDRIQVKGKTEPETVSPCLGARSSVRIPISRNCVSSPPECYGLTASRIGREQSKQSSFAARLPNGSASTRYMTCMPNASRLRRDPPPPDWDGVYEAESK
jgi:adenylate cyclase